MGRILIALTVTAALSMPAAAHIPDHCRDTKLLIEALHGTTAARENLSEALAQEDMRRAREAWLDYLRNQSAFGTEVNALLECIEGY